MLMFYRLFVLYEAHYEAARVRRRSSCSNPSAYGSTLERRRGRPSITFADSSLPSSSTTNTLDKKALILAIANKQMIGESIEEEEREDNSNFIYKASSDDNKSSEVLVNAHHEQSGLTSSSDTNGTKTLLVIHKATSKKKTGLKGPTSLRKQVVTVLSTLKIRSKSRGKANGNKPSPTTLKLFNSKAKQNGNDDMLPSDEDIGAHVLKNDVFVDVNDTCDVKFNDDIRDDINQTLPDPPEFLINRLLESPESPDQSLPDPPEDMIELP